MVVYQLEISRVLGSFSMVVAGKRRVHYKYGVAAGIRGWGPKRDPCTVHGGAAGPCHSSFGCDLTPDPEEAGQRIAGVVITIVGPPSLPYHRVEFSAISTKIGTNGTGIGGSANLS